MPPVRPIFTGITLAISGKFEGWTETDISRWVTMHGGRFVQEVDDSVTHLVCTFKEYKKKTTQVVAATKSPKPCHIVSPDWLEDSLNKRRKLPVKPFLHAQLLKDHRAKKKEAERRIQARIDEKRDALFFVPRTLYRIYRDSTYFEYKVTIVRDDPDANIYGERYVLHLFESVATSPHLYWFAAKHYKRKGLPADGSHRPSDTCQSFATEFRHFTEFFAAKTGVAWDERLVRSAPAGGVRFRYEAPLGGKPVGVIEDATNIPSSVATCQSTLEPQTVKTAVTGDVLEGEKSDDSRTLQGSSSE